ncbi:MAG: type I-D CRISPR-associated protein Cas10d/Csc3 [Halobacteriales archaeon]|nr:type I-D CRISPR-associated protein Cas10d/Csc3 [Halobacteriales archaeon]
MTEQNPVIQNAGEYIEEFEKEEEDTDEHDEIALDYLRNVDGRLIDLGWGFEGAKTVEFGNTDQSLLNHVRNGVFFLLHLNQVADNLDDRVLSPDDLRDVVAMFVAHDLHKTIYDEDYNPEEEFDIPREVVEEFAEDTDLLDFADSATIEDLWSCACAHHDTWNAKTGKETLAWKERKYYVRLADSFASSPTPEEAVSDRSVAAFDDVFYESLDLGYHSLDETTGVLTNLLNAAVADLLSDYGYEVVAIYQDGCVYVSKGDEKPEVDESFVEDVYETFTEKVRNSHRSYANAVELAENINTVYNLGYYSPSDEDFFYAGPESVVHALAHKAAADGNVDNAPTDSMVSSIQEAGEALGVELDETRQLIGVARLVGGIKKTIIPELDVEDEIQATAEVFGVSDAFLEKLAEIDEETHDELTAGGKFDYSYGIAQELLDREVNGVTAKKLSASDFGDAVGDLLVENLSGLDGWDSIAEAFVSDIRDELTAYISDILVVEGKSPDYDAEIDDTFDQYTSKRGGKIGWLTNRTTTGMNKSEMEAKKSLTTLQAGFSNHTRVGASKPENLLISVPMRIEFSLRETGSNWREPDRLFFHFVPDYFFTPMSWEMTRAMMNRYDDDARVRVGRLAEALFESKYGEEEYTEVLENLSFNEDGGRNMVESMMQGFDDGFGSFEMAYYKQSENQTEFEFFGIFVALAVAGFTGLRVYVSSNPVPDLRARDFDEMARIGAGLSQTSRFYGESVRLTELQDTLRTASALISLGYATERKDSLFPKYLRATRNKLLPGSYLLKRIAQNNPDEGSRIAWNLMDEAKYLDTTTGVKIE